MWVAKWLQFIYWNGSKFALLAWKSFGFGGLSPPNPPSGGSAPRTPHYRSPVYQILKTLSGPSIFLSRHPGLRTCWLQILVKNRNIVLFEVKSQEYWQNDCRKWFQIWRRLIEKQKSLIKKTKVVGGNHQMTIVIYILPVRLCDPVGGG